MIIKLMDILKKKLTGKRSIVIGCTLVLVIFSIGFGVFANIKLNSHFREAQVVNTPISNTPIPTTPKPSDGKGSSTAKPTISSLGKYEDIIEADYKYDTIALINHTVWNWGNQSEKSSVSKNFLPRQVLKNVYKIYKGYDNEYAIKVDGSLWAWGDNEKGQLLDGTRINSSKPIKVRKEVSNFRVINDDNSGISIVILDSKVSVFRERAFNEAESNVLKNIKEYFPTHMSNVTGYLLTKHNELWSFDNGELKKITSNVKLFEFNFIGLIIKNDGSLWTLGTNYLGSLGTGDNNKDYYFKKVPTKILNDVKTAGAFEEDSVIYDCYAIKNDDSLWMWGANYVVLGNFGKDCSRPKKVLYNVESIIANPIGCAYALKKDGSFWCWGDGIGVRKHKKLTFLANDVQSIVGDPYVPYGVLFYKKDHSLWTLSSSFKAQEVGDNSTYLSFYDGGLLVLNKEGNLFKWTNGKSKTILENVISNFEVNDTYFAIKKNGTVWGWGSNLSGAIGDGTNIDKSKSVKVKIPENAQ